MSNFRLQLVKHSAAMVQVNRSVQFKVIATWNSGCQIQAQPLHGLPYILHGSLDPLGPCIRYWYQQLNIQIVFMSSGVPSRLRYHYLHKKGL